MGKKQLIFLCLIGLFFSCKSISVQNKQYQTTTQKVVLGSVGQDENFVLEKTYNNVAIPLYSTPIKVRATPVAFNKTSFKNFQDAQAFQDNNIQIKYVDSLENKPKFLNIETIDEVGLMNLLNGKLNTDIKQYLLNQKESHVVTNVSMVFSEDIYNDILQADELFLEASGKKSIAISLYKDKEVYKTIHFKEGVVFAYRSSSCCWKENDKYQLEIVDLVEGDNKCPNKTYLSASKAKKEINYYKF